MSLSKSGNLIGGPNQYLITVKSVSLIMINHIASARVVHIYPETEKVMSATNRCDRYVIFTLKK